MSSESLSNGVVRATDSSGLPVSLLRAIDDAGGLWRAGDYYAPPSTIVSTAVANDVRALRLDARDLSFLRDLPDLEFLHLRSDGRPALDPVVFLPRLRGLIIETGGLHGRLDLKAHPNLEWLKVKLSGKGGRENLPAIMEGHPTLQHLQLNEVPFTDLSAIALAFPSLRRLRIRGGDKLRTLGDLAPWQDTLEGFSCVFVPLSTIKPFVEWFTKLRFIGISAGKLPSLAEFQQLPSLGYLSLLGGVASLAPLAGHPSIRLARFSMPEDGDLTPLAMMPALSGLIGARAQGAQLHVPLLEDLPFEHELVREWRTATDSSESLLSP